MCACFPVIGPVITTRWCHNPRSKNSRYYCIKNGSFALSRQQVGHSQKTDCGLDIEDILLRSKAKGGAMIGLGMRESMDKDSEYELQDEGKEPRFVKQQGKKSTAFGGTTQHG